MLRPLPTTQADGNPPDLREAERVLPGIPAAVQHAKSSWTAAVPADRDYRPHARQPIQMRAILDKYSRIDDKGPYTPRKYVIYWPLDEAEMRLDATRVAYGPICRRDICVSESWAGEVEELDAAAVRLLIRNSRSGRLFVGIRAAWHLLAFLLCVLTVRSAFAQRPRLRRSRGPDRRRRGPALDGPRRKRSHVPVLSRSHRPAGFGRAAQCRSVQLIAAGQQAYTFQEDGSFYRYSDECPGFTCRSGSSFRCDRRGRRSARINRDTSCG